MYAVVGRWTLDPAQRENQKPVLMERIVPGVRQLPGLVERDWAGDEDEGDRALTFIVFDTLDAAESFAADVRGNTDAQSAGGVQNLELTVLPVTAET